MSTLASRLSSLSVLPTGVSVAPDGRVTLAGRHIGTINEGGRHGFRGWNAKSDMVTPWEGLDSPEAVVWAIWSAAQPVTADELAALRAAFAPDLARFPAPDPVWATSADPYANATHIDNRGADERPRLAVDACFRAEVLHEEIRTIYADTAHIFLAPRLYGDDGDAAILARAGIARAEALIPLWRDACRAVAVAVEAEIAAKPAGKSEFYRQYRPTGRWMDMDAYAA